MKKRTIIIQGGPGTGKSVLAVNLLKEYISKGYNASYVTKNSAPREAYLKLLSKSDLKKEVNIKQLFRSPFGLCHSPSNYYDCLIVDEAHRLKAPRNMMGTELSNIRTNNIKLGLDRDNGTQLDWILNKSKYQILFYDEFQSIKRTDIDRQKFKDLEKNSDVFKG